MAKFHDQIEALKGVEGDYPGDFIDTIIGAYDEDFSAVATANDEAAGLASAKIAELEAANAALTAEIVTIKAAKYDEIMSSPVEPNGDEDDDNFDDDGDDIDDDFDDTDPFEKLFDK